MKVLSIISTITRTNVPVRKVQQVRNIAQNLEVAKSSTITSALKSYYRDAGEKLNDILLDRKRQRLSTTVVEHNIDAYNKLPSWLQRTLRPSDVSKNGHMDQEYIRELWDAGKEAHRTGVAGRCPVFRGEAVEEELAEDTLEIFSDNLPALSILDGNPTEILTTLDNLPATTGSLVDLEKLGDAGGVADVTDVADVADVTDVVDSEGVIAKVIDVIQDIL